MQKHNTEALAAEGTDTMEEAAPEAEETAPAADRRAAKHCKLSDQHFGNFTLAEISDQNLRHSGRFFVALHSCKTSSGITAFTACSLLVYLQISAQSTDKAPQSL